MKYLAVMTSDPNVVSIGEFEETGEFVDHYTTCHPSEVEAKLRELDDEVAQMTKEEFEKWVNC